MRTLVMCAGTLITSFVFASSLPASTKVQESAPVSLNSGKIAPWLVQQFQSGGKYDVFVVMSASSDLSAASGIASRAERGRYVYDALREQAAVQSPLVDWLHSKGYDVTRFWIINAILVKQADAALIDTLSRRDDVDRLVGDPVVDGLARSAVPSSTVDVSTTADRLLSATSGDVPAALDKADSRATRRRAALIRASSGSASAADLRSSSGQTPVLPSSSLFTPEAIECGVTTIHADGVWTQTGLRGDGIVVATMDTGVEWTHPALKPHYRGWDGATADHSYSWHDAIGPTTAPLDDNQHGTHVTGTMVGDDGAGNQIGVAPGAKWIGCRNMDHGNGTPATYLDCMQWGLAPYPLGADPLKDGRPDLAADITNNSWSCPPSEGCDPFTLQQAFEHLRAAGQLTVGAAQNAGPQCSTITAPLGLHDAVFTVGAVDCAGVLAGFSSRGPITSDGSGRQKPNVAAPGVSVRSSLLNNTYGPLSGTSMATPHTSGAAALLWSSRPNLRHLVRITRCYLEKSALTATLPNGVPQTCGGTTPATVPNNFWGWGRIDALSAVNYGPDTDTDGIADGCDCAPADGGSFEAPAEVTGDGFIDPTTYAWDSMSATAGTGTTYDVVRGLVSVMIVSGGFAGATCIANDQSSASYSDIDLPPEGDAFYYLARAQNGCGNGDWGAGLGGAPRTVTSCP